MRDAHSRNARAAAGRSPAPRQRRADEGRHTAATAGDTADEPAEESDEGHRAAAADPRPVARTDRDASVADRRRQAHAQVLAFSRARRARAGSVQSGS